MKNHIIKNCKGCNEPLRIPADIGGMLMRCPNCGHQFHTDFKLVPKERIDGNGKESSSEMPAQRPPSTFSVIV
jgi:DNA-directed RNA polymerase subunit M/transcription elongation factor TFIIS